MAPKKFTGSHALSVENEKNFLALVFFANFYILRVFSKLTSIILIRIKGSLSLRTCFIAEKLSQISYPLFFFTKASKLSLPTSKGKVSIFPSI